MTTLVCVGFELNQFTSVISPVVEEVFYTVKSSNISENIQLQARFLHQNISTSISNMHLKDQN